MRAMLVRDIGEFPLIERLVESIKGDGDRLLQRIGQSGYRLRLSIGDDAAAWESPSGTSVFTTDTMVEGVHFNLDNTGWHDLGWKALAVNLSDIAAMGCEPTYSLVTLGLRGDLPVDGLLEMYGGLMEVSKRCGGAVVGGDIVRSPVFFVTVALLGRAPEAEPNKTSPILRRDAASPTSSGGSSSTGTWRPARCACARAMRPRLPCSATCWTRGCACCTPSCRSSRRRSGRSCDPTWRRKRAPP